MREWSRRNSVVKHLGCHFVMTRLRTRHFGPSFCSFWELLLLFYQGGASESVLGNLSIFVGHKIVWTSHNKLIEVLLRHDKFLFLDIDSKAIDNGTASAIAKLLRETKNLLSLRLSENPDYWVCDEEKKLEILESLAENKSLCELTTNVSLFHSIVGVPLCMINIQV